MNDFTKIRDHYKHGLAHTPEWNSWMGMKRRCYSVNGPKYSAYGGRGITVCDHWKRKPDGFINFIKDMGFKPSKLHSLNRIDNDGNYEPGNCEWALPHVQSSNKRNNLKVVGVYHMDAIKHKSPWRAMMIVNKKKVLDKSFETQEAAIKARRSAELKYFGFIIDK